MKRIGIVLSAILTLCPLYLTAQQTDAPDQDDLFFPLRLDLVAAIAARTFSAHIPFILIH